MGFVQREVEGNLHDTTTTNIEVMDPSPADEGSHIPVGSFSSGIPSRPGRGFLQVETSRGSFEQRDVQPMEESDEDERQHSGEEAQMEANEATKSTIKAFARNKMKALRRGKSYLRPSTIGDTSRGSDALEHSGIDRKAQTQK